MRFWRDMPRSMFLKSLGFATTIDNPERLTFHEWCRERGLEDREPCSMESFAEYGLWLQRRLVPEVEPVEVSLIERSDGMFRVGLATGERLEARRIVVAVGLRYFQRVPAALSQLPPHLASHTAQHDGYARFAGKDVCVIGAGQSALEAAVLLHESGARPQLLMRRAGPVFYGKTPLRRSILARLRSPLTVLGEGRMHWVLQHFPLVPHLVPDAYRVPFSRSYLGPAGAWWLRDRFQGKVAVRARCEVVSARPEGDGVLLRLREHDGREREIRADHVIAGTGFEVDLDRLPFLDRELRSTIARIEGAPRLDRHFQSSVPGLYFAGILSLLSFGPLFRFVAGTRYAGPAIARNLVRGAQRVAVSHAPADLRQPG
jgi:thioredoxin reductase